MPDASIGRPVALSVLDFGLFRVAAGRDVGLQGFLVETDLGRRILIDTGMPAGYVSDPEGAATRDGLGAFGHVLRLTDENLLPGQLSRLGLRPADIDLVVLTHGHIDHVGGLAEVAHAPIVVAAAERSEPRPLYFGDARPLPWPDARYVEINGDCSLAPDLEIWLAPGHSPGTLAVFLTLHVTGPVCLTSDVVSRPSEPDEGFLDADDPARARASAARLLGEAHRRDAWTVWGHCPDQWPTLQKAPHKYL